MSGPQLVLRDQNCTSNITEPVENSSDVSSGAHTVYMIIFSSLNSFTLLECVVTLIINTLNTTLQDKPATVFANSLSGSIAMLSSVSIFVMFYRGGLPWRCFISAICLRYLHTVSCYNLASLALDRYVAICWPLRYNMWFTKFRCLLVSTACWTVPFFLVLVPGGAMINMFCLEGKRAMFLIFYIVVYASGAVLTFVWYALVALEFRRSTSVGSTYNRDRIQHCLRLRTARSALKVIAFYLLLSLPHTVYPLVSHLLDLYQYGDHFKHLGIAFNIINRVHLLMFLPVYAWANADFHRALRVWMRCCRPCHTQPKIQENSQTSVGSDTQLKEISYCLPQPT